MRKLAFHIGVVLLASLVCVGGVSAQEEATDITEDVLTGPGSVSVTTKKGIQMSFGAQIRMIPTTESNWDFGLGDDLQTDGYIGGAYNDSLFKVHLNESGWVNNGYIRSESRLYFNALPEDRKWSFYAALEYDRPIDTDTVDNRGGGDASSNFGLERLHATYALPMNMRFHAGWDIWGVDIIDGGGLVYGDDNPGFWLTGDYDTWSFNIGYFKLHENNFQTSTEFFDRQVAGVPPLTLEDWEDEDRTLYAGYLTFNLNEDHKVQPFYTYDRIRSVPVRDFLGFLSGGATGIVTGEKAHTDSHHIGAYYTGKFGMLELFAEGVYQFGSADDTGLAQEDFDISAYALAADIALELKDFVGFSLKPHAGILYTSGDDDPDDDELSGYMGVENAQRFSQYWGGENTIIGDTNFVFGSLLYGYLPELYGNGTPVFTGGLENGAGYGGGRGDNPGLTMSSFGLTATPKKFIIFRSNVNSFWWNEDFVVQSFAAPNNPVTGQAISTVIDAGYVGTEWDNELTVAMSKNTFVKGQCSFFFPGDGIEDVTSALSATPFGPGEKSDDIASRWAAELIWKF